MNKLTALLGYGGGTTDDADVRSATGVTAPDPFVFLAGGAQRRWWGAKRDDGRARGAMPWAG